MLGMAVVKRNFRVQAHMCEPVMDRFISFLRFTLFDENIALLYQIKAQWEQRRKQPKNSYDESSDDDANPKFDGSELPFISKRNEGLVWSKIK